MAHSFDATLKELLAPNPEDFVSIFGLPGTLPAVPLNVDLSTISAATDVAIGFGEPLQEIADLNFQSGPDAKIADRCHLYSAALRFRFGVPVRTLLILLRPKADSSQIDGKLAYTSGASGVEFRYEVIRMWQRPAEPFLRGPLQVLPLATLCQMPPDRPLVDGLRDVVRAIDARLVHEGDHAKAVRLMTAAFILTGLRVEREMIGSIYEGVRIMHESTAFDYYVEEGLKKGLQKGLAKGAIDEAQRMLLRLGQKKGFGPCDESTTSALKDINDLDRLERLGDAVLVVNSWQELLATP